MRHGLSYGAAMATTTKPPAQRSWITDLLSLGVWLALPYLVVGILWADAHREQLDQLRGLDAAASWAGEVVAWPVLVFADVTLR